jgi:hypothetical protein
MKPYLILLISLLTAFTLSAQSWAEIGTTWTYTEFYAFSAEQNPVTVQCTQDTMFQGRLCKFLVKGAESCDGRPLNEITYEDSGKVYYYDNQTSSFQILYDINALPGQSWTNYFNGYQSGDSIVTTVDSTKTVVINNVTLKELIVHFTSVGLYAVSNEVTDTIIQYIGNKYYLFPWVDGACDGNFFGPLRCYSDSSIGFYDFHTAPDCEYISSINELSRQVDFNVYPNPTSGQTTISYNFPGFANIRLEITNTLGQVVYTESLPDNTAIKKIDISALPAGLYAVAIREDGTLLGITKLVRV